MGMDSFLVVESFLIKDPNAFVIDRDDSLSGEGEAASSSSCNDVNLLFFPRTESIQPDTFFRTEFSSSVAVLLVLCLDDLELGREGILAVPPESDFLCLEGVAGRSCSSAEESRSISERDADALDSARLICDALRFGSLGERFGSLGDRLGSFGLLNVCMGPSGRRGTTSDVLDLSEDT